MPSLHHLFLAIIALALTACDSKPSGKYQSSVILQINPSIIRSYAPLQNSERIGLSHRPTPPNYLKVIVSPENLQAASENCGIDPKTLKDSLVVEELRGTDFIKVTAYNDDQAKAKKIVEAVTESFIAHQTQIETERAQKALEVLDEELQRHGDLVHEKQKSLTALIQKYRFSSSENLKKETVTSIAREYTTTKEAYEQSRDLHRKMKTQQQEQRILLRMPRTPITIHQAAH